MKIALDYDKTYNVDRNFWDTFVAMCKAYNHEVRIVTARSPNLDKDSVDVHPSLQDSIIFCDGVAKRFVCTHFADDCKGWVPDVWIDDKPEGVDKNSTATREILEAWRESDEYHA